MKVATAEEETLQILSKVVKNSWPSQKGKIPTGSGYYRGLCDEIH